MKRILTLLCVLSVLSAPVFSGVVKKTKSEVTFKGFGSFSTSQSEKLVPQKHRVDSQNDFKGKGLLGGLAKKVLKKKPSGEEAQEPTVAYHIEVLEISLADLGDSDFHVPADYKKKG